MTYADLFSSTFRLAQLSVRIVLHRKFLFAGLGVVVYYGILYAILVFRPSDGFSVEEALRILVQIPGAVLAIYLSMDLVASERDGDTLETLFSASASHYVVWLIRIGCLHVVLALTVMSMSTVSYFLFAEHPFVLGGLNALISTLFVANLTFLFAVSVRNSNSAGMLALGALIVSLITQGSTDGTVYSLFLNPFEPPTGVDLSLWADTVLINRGLVVVGSAVTLYLALSKMGRRDRLLN